MANKMLIDATHPEETRVVVLRGKRVQEFDYESAARKQLRGNIYLAKVTRVEPSLQAAFVDYGGNRHGFLAFSEIHPDYYQIPVADREALLEEEFKEEAEAAALDEEPVSSNEIEFIDDLSEDDTDASGPEYIALDIEEQKETLSEDVLDQSANEDEPQLENKSSPEDKTSEKDAEDVSTSEENAASLIDDSNEQSIVEASNNDLITGFDDNLSPSGIDDSFVENDQDSSESSGDEADDVESVGSEDALEELPQRIRKRKKTYKIQEVIKRRQIILVQVVKEERGNKGAALTTYLSLAGRHTVLMPNTARGGGISRKITNLSDRKRLRKIASELEIPEGTGLIIRTAGASRTKAEIKRDYEYLLRLWENVRDLTMESTAPSVVYEEGDLIKRSIRDLYSKEVDEVWVAGEAAHKDAKHFMRMIMPSHAKNVKLYKDHEPIFIKNQIEHQLNELYSPYVTLPSGGYIVINQTEALVSIDVNSGKSTKEHNIEDTAVRTNLEAAEEISRQLKLRDLAGLVVIDFIDMDERKNNRAVERKLKDCLRSDRARIQIGRISHFGLLEMSRQRLRTGVLEGSTTQCPHCQGTGIIRSTDSVALSVLRVLEDTLLAGDTVDLSAITSVDVALYILNHKRLYLKDIESRYGVNVSIIADQKLQGANFQIERSETSEKDKNDNNLIVKMDWGFQAPEETQSKSPSKGDEDDGRKRRKRRRRSKDRDDYTAHEAQTDTESRGGEATETLDSSNTDQNADDDENKTNDRRSRTRRRGRRGGRRHRSQSSDKQFDSNENQDAEDTDKSNDPVRAENLDVTEVQSHNSESGQSTTDESDDKQASDTKRGRMRRRYPAGRKRGPRRRPRQSEETEQEYNESSSGQSAAESASQTVNETKADETSSSQKGSADKKNSHSPRKIRKDADTPNTGSTSNSADQVREKVLEPQNDALAIEQQNMPARKGWWQKRV